MPFGFGRPRPDPSDDDDLTEVLVQLMTGGDLEEAATLVQEDPRLLLPRVDEFLAEVIRVSQERGNEEYARKVPFWREFLRKCREEGSVAALESITGGGLTAPETSRQALERVAGLEARVEAGDGSAVRELADLWAEIADDPRLGEEHRLLRAAAYTNRAGALQRGDDLPAAVEAMRTALRLLPQRSARRPVFLLNLARTLSDVPDLDALREAVGHVEHAVRIDRGTAARGADVLQSIGATAYALFERRHSLAAIDLVITTERMMLDGDYPDGAGVAAERLAQCLLGRYKLSRDLDDLAEAAEVAERACLAWPAGSPQWSGARNVLAICLRRRFTETGDPAALDRAIEIHTETLAAAPGTDTHVHHLHGLGAALRFRHELSGDPADLMAAAQAHQEMYERVGPDDPIYDTVLDGYGQTLFELHRLTGRLDDLKRAVAMHREAVARTDDGSTSASVNNLAIGLRHLYGRTGDIAALEEAIAILRGALADGVLSADLETSLFTLGSCLMDAYMAFHDPDTGAEALDILEQVLARTPPTSTARPVRLGNLAGMLTAWQSRRGGDGWNAGTAARVESLLTEAAAATSGAERARHLSNLAAALNEHPDHAESEESVRRFVAVMEEVCALVPATAINGAGYRLNLTTGYRQLHDLTGDPAALARGLECLREGCATGLGQQPLSVLVLADSWGEHALFRERWDEAVEAYGYAMDALDRLVAGVSVRDHQQQWLRRAQSLAADAAAAHVGAGDAWSAALALERGRARFLADALGEDTAEIDRLAVAYPEQAAAYRQASTLMRDLQRQALSQATGELPPESFARAREQLDETLTLIRSLRGFERFLLRDPGRDIVEAGRKAPLAYLVARGASGFALVVDGASATVCPMPGLNLQELRTRLPAYFTDYERAGQDVGRWHKRLDQTTRWLWEVVMGPLLTAMPDSPAITLIPTGMLASLPLHAAWEPDPATSTGRRYALDERTLVFAPSANAAARPGPDRARLGRLLAVDDPQPVTATALPFSPQEADAAMAALPGGRRLSGEQATREAVLSAIDGHDVLHFACHGYADWGQVLDSHLLLAGDERLTLRDLLVMPAQEGRLVILSACESALPHVDVADEVVGLATGFLHNGAAGVIGSMWRVPDVSTALLLSRYYTLWTEGVQPARALLLAQQWLRDSTNGALHAAHPEVMNRYAPIPESLRAAWGAGRDFAHPAYWAAFTYMGA